MRQRFDITRSKDGAMRRAVPRRALPRALLAVALVFVWTLAAGTAWAQDAPPEAEPSSRADTAPEAEPMPSPQSPPAAEPSRRGTTYAEWLSGRSDDWRIDRLASNPRILLIEFPNLLAQGRALNRIAALLEKRDTPRTRVLGDAALAAAIRKSGDTAETYLFGHDYAADGLLRFFALAERQKVALNAHEQRLREVLRAEGLIGEAAGAVELPQALVTFTAVQDDRPETLVDESVDAERREAVLRHELSHGEFFTNAAYREHCWAFWRRLSEAERRLLRKFLSGLDYDPADEALMVNEAQAFLMHTPDARVFSAPLLGVAQARLDDLRARFREGAPPGLFDEVDK